MIILKWYSIIMLVLGLIASIYDCGRKKQGRTAFFTLLLNIPIIVFLILA